MRVRVQDNGIEVTVITGTYGALISIRITDDTKVNRIDFLGFEIKRDDITEDQSYPLKGFKYFEETGQTSLKGDLFDTDKQPIQSCYWEDFSVKCNHEYVYHVIPVYGKPKKLTYGAEAAVTIHSEDDEGTVHSVHFNRGVAGSLAYSRRFQNQRPDKMSDADKVVVRKWLSRGLEEALLGFIQKAIDNGYGLRVAFYEFTYDAVLKKLKEAFDKGLDVKVIYDSRDEEGENEDAIDKNKLERIFNGTLVLIPRKNDPQVPAHNKFMILLDNNKPIEVWTGSTNITDKGILGQSNVGHHLRNESVAAKYLEYWKGLASDPDLNTIRGITNVIQKDLQERSDFNDDITVFFSPRENKSILKAYSSFIRSASAMVCGIFPFSFSKDMKLALSNESDALKFIMVDKIGNANGITKTNNSVIVDGAYFSKPMFDWLVEINSGVLLNKNANPVIGTNYVHNKLLLIDPLTDSPVVIVGSANFSEPSIVSNDENTIVIKGGPELRRICDIYFTEFYRIFHHFFVRKATSEMNMGDDTTVNSINNPLHLKTDNSWLAQFNSDQIKVKMQKQISMMPLDFP